ncbi:hypothetical protein [Novosphingobium malaysiense]|uniref:hypothetical protein n=1 Tax=Novosphingobium malaysiense TaxID=1348853 RepID=UPI0012E04912|nr:hypothetical protein [Novosphingobium malaysiense]
MKPFQKFLNIAMISITLLCIVTFIYIAYKSNIFIYSTNKQNIDEHNLSNQDAINAVFGTLQFSISVISSLVVIISVVISVFVGRTLRDAQSTARKEIEEFANLYRNNLDQIDKTLSVQASSAISAYMSSNDVSKLLDQYKKDLKSIEKDREDILPIIREYREFNNARKEQETDFNGPFLSLNGEYDEVKEIDRNSEEIDREKAISEFKFSNRSKMRQSLLLLEEGALRRKVSANDAFNGAQVASSFHFSELSHRLAVCANWLHSTILYQARVFRAEYERGDRFTAIPSAEEGRFTLVSDNPSNNELISNEIRNNAHEKIFGLFNQGDFLEIHLVLSEIWNVAVRSNSLETYISEAETNISRHNEAGIRVPAYAYAQLARAYAMFCPTGWATRAEDVLQKANEALQEESIISMSYIHSLQEMRYVQQALSSI